MTAVLLDTHAVVWYLLDAPELSSGAAAAIEQARLTGKPIFVSVISIVEVRYLVERSRLPPAALRLLELAVTDAPAPLAAVPIDLGVVQAVARVPRDQVADLPDRLIAATALSLDVPLITRDRAIRATQVATVW
jgi:PIN domain nuclease of toxin-antitoxin system